MTFDEWLKTRNIKDNPFIHESVVKWCKVAFEAGQRSEREAALLAQPFEIAHCISCRDDAVDHTASAIKEAIIDRGTEQ